MWIYFIRILDKKYFWCLFLALLLKIYVIQSNLIRVGRLFQMT